MNKPHNSTIIALVTATFLAGMLLYVVWNWANQWLNLPDWIFFLAYTITIPTFGFYKAIYWGYWMANPDKEAL